MKVLFIEGKIHCRNQLITHSWINYGGALREMVWIYDMYNACRLCHYPFPWTDTSSKEKGEVVVSLPPHNVNAHFYKRVMSYLRNRKSRIYPKTCYAVRNYHTTMTVPLPVWSEKLSIVEISYYYGLGPLWNNECYSFVCLKHQWTWLYNGALLHFISYGFRDKHRSSTLLSGIGGNKMQVSTF